MGIILLETLIILISGVLGVYLLWLVNGRKLSLSQLFNKHGYTIGVLLFLVVVVVVALFRTLCQ